MEILSYSSGMHRVIRVSSVPLCGLRQRDRTLHIASMGPAYRDLRLQVSMRAAPIHLRVCTWQRSFIYAVEEPRGGDMGPLDRSA